MRGSVDVVLIEIRISIHDNVLVINSVKIRNIDGKEEQRLDYTFWPFSNCVWHIGVSRSEK